VAREEQRNDEYSYDTLADTPQHMSWSQPHEKEIPVEEYMPPGLSEEEAI
jgi:hypothetical protein